MSKHDALRIGIINQHEAIIYYRDGTMITLHSDTDVRHIIEIVCLPITYEGSFDSYNHSMDDTQSINVKEIM